MACSCSTKKGAGLTYKVVKQNGSTYKVYSNKTEADAAALRVGGRVVTQS